MKTSTLLKLIALSTFVVISTTTNTSVALDYAIADTAQENCFDNSSTIAAPYYGDDFYGQDAQHTGNSPSYTVSGDGVTVEDNVTGLIWTKTADWNYNGTIDADDKFTYSDAFTYVETLNDANYGGYDDWRVPSIKELYSLIDYRGTDINPTATGSSGAIPFIDDGVFDFAYGDTASGERIIDSQWVTSTVYTATVMGGQQAMFGVNFADGRIKGYPINGDGPEGEKTYYARFVRGNTAYGVNNFTDNEDGTISDNATALMWAQSDSIDTMDWQTALAWVQQKNSESYLGFSDWRLPNAKELQSIVDYTRCPDITNSAAIDPLFDCTEITNLAGQSDYGFYWTSTSFKNFLGDASNAVYIVFGRGLGTMDGVNIIDVHGAGCQRSDPKTGEADDYPEAGHGPQGDVQRVFNFVRLVRDDTSSSVIAGDADNDGDVDITDFLILKSNYGTTTGATWQMGDFDSNGTVDIFDFLALKANYGS